LIILFSDHTFSATHAPGTTTTNTSPSTLTTSSTMRAVFGSKVMHWKGVLDGSEKKALSKFVNQKLEACLGVRLTPTSKGSDMKYKLNHLFVL
jgi:hypothetical protein